MLGWLFRRSKSAGAAGDAAGQGAAMDQAVLVHIPLSGWPDEAMMERMYALEDQLIEAVRKVGEFDGNEWGEDEGTLYLYGPDADRLWDAMEGHVRAAGLPEGSWAVKRYGEPGAREERVELG